MLGWEFGSVGRNVGCFRLVALLVGVPFGKRVIYVGSGASVL
jgi:hypothetical protein